MHDIHEYIVYDKSIIPYYLTQPWNELRGIDRWESQGK